MNESANINTVYLFIFFMVGRSWTQDHDTWNPPDPISALGAIAWSEQVFLFIFSLRTAKYIRLAAGAKFPSFILLQVNHQGEEGKHCFAKIIRNKRKV